MFGGTLTSKARPIGLDVGSNHVRLMQVEPGQHGSHRVVAAASARLNGEASFGSDDYHRLVADAVARAYDAGAFTGKRVVSGLPASAVQYKNLRLPKMPPNEMRAAVEWEASDRLQLSSEPYTVQYFDAGEVRQGDELRQEVILLACPTGFVEKHVKAITDAGLTPTAVDVVPAALARCIAAARTDGSVDDAQVVIDVGYGGTKVLITRGEDVLFFKLLDIGGKQFNETVAKHLSLPEGEVSELRRRMDNGKTEESGVRGQGSDEGAEEASGGDGEGGPLKEHVRRAVYEAVRPTVNELGREVGLCLRYYSVTFRGRRPEVAHVVGGEAQQPWLAPMLSECAGVEVSASNPLTGFDVSAVAPVVERERPIVWGVSAGLSIRPESNRMLRAGVPALAGSGARGVAA